MKTIRFGIIGCGLMGREFASAAARWCHLLDVDVRPEIVGICDKNADLFGWYKKNFPSITFYTGEHKELLARKDVDAIYCAVPHNLHAEIYEDIINAGKHLLGEKPFGIDAPANERILKAIQKNPNVFVRCSSEFPFFPAVQKIIAAAKENRFGTILEVESGFHHSSDLDPTKPINWKRMIRFNGEYGCMGDLGMHTLHVPLRLGWIPQDVRACLSKIVRERPGKDGKMEPCETWDNATLLCNAKSNGQTFPITITTKRISPGDTDTWFLKVRGTKLSMEFSTQNPKTLRWMDYSPGGRQAWMSEDLGYTPLFKTITGHIFEFGFTDAILQMWAAFCLELSEGAKAVHFGCATPQETVLSHKLFTAALKSQKENSVVVLEV
ncbi:MAG TPA: Gfo/Idh/MocA family oxidoreductase [Planctomycetota bacterium]|nr:Gfo/Idh/MocA family oxidoreductase [Planctomycetota bacterium]